MLKPCNRMDGINAMKEIKLRCLISEVDFCALNKEFEQVRKLMLAKPEFLWTSEEKLLKTKLYNCIIAGLAKLHDYEEVLAIIQRRIGETKKWRKCKVKISVLKSMMLDRKWCTLQMREASDKLSFSSKLNLDLYHALLG